MFVLRFEMLVKVKSYKKPVNFVFTDLAIPKVYKKIAPMTRAQFCHSATHFCRKIQNLAISCHSMRAEISSTQINQS